MAVGDEYRLTAVLAAENQAGPGVAEFNREIDSAEAHVRRLEREVKVPITSNPDAAFATVAEVERRMDSLTRETRVLTIGADTRGVDEAITRMDQRLDQSLGRKREVMITADTREAEQRLSGFESWVQGLAQRISQMNSTLNVGANTSAAEDRIKGFEGVVQGAADRIAQLKPSLNVGANTSQADQSITGFESRVQGVAGRISQMNPQFNVTANTGGAEQQVRGFEGSVQGTAQRISQMNPILNLRANSTEGLATVRAFGASVEETARRINSTRATLRTDADTSSMDANLNRSQGFIQSIFGRVHRLNIDDAAASRLPVALGDINAALGRFAIVGAAASAAVFPLMQAGLAAIISTGTAAGAALFGVVEGLGRAAGGAAAFGASIIAGVGGLKAYTAILKDAVKFSQDGTFAFTGYSRAAEIFNSHVALLRTGFQDLRVELAGQALPTLIQFANTGLQYLPLLSQHGSSLVRVLGGVGLGFVEVLNSARQMNIIDGLMRSAVTSAGLLGLVLGNVALSAVNVFAAALPHGNALLGTVSDLILRFRLWSQTVEGQASLDRFFAAGAEAAINLVRAMVDIGAGFGNIGAALHASGLSSFITGGLADAAARFRDMAAAGTDTRAAIEAFGVRAQPILAAAGNAALKIVGEFFRVADSVSKVVDPQTGLPLMSTILKAIGDAARPIGNLLIGSFETLGPILPGLIRNMALLAEAFAGATPILGAFLRLVNSALTAFNSLSIGTRQMIVAGLAVITILGGLTNAFRLLNVVMGGIPRALLGIGARLLGLGGSSRKAGDDLVGFGRNANEAGRQTSAFRQILGTIGGAFAAAGRGAVSAGRAVGTGFAGALRAGGSGAATAARGIAAGTVAALRGGSSAASAAGRGISTAFGAAVRAGGAVAGAAARGVASLAAAGFRALPAPVQAAGRSLASGFASAIRGGASLATAAARGVGSAAAGAFRATTAGATAAGRGLSAAFGAAIRAGSAAASAAGRLVSSAAARAFGALPAPVQAAGRSLAAAFAGAIRAGAAAATAAARAVASGAAAAYRATSSAATAAGRALSAAFSTAITAGRAAAVSAARGVASAAAAAYRATSTLATAAGRLLSTAFGRGISSGGPAASSAGRTAATRVVTAMRGVVPIAATVGRLLITAFTGPVGIAITVIAALAAGVLYAYRNFEGFRRVVDTVGRAIRSGLTAALNAGRAALTSLGNFISTLPARFSSVVAFFRSLPATIMAALRALPGQVGSLFSSAASSAGNALRALPGILTGAIGTAARAALDGLRVFADTFVEVVRDLPRLAGIALGTLAGVLVGVIVLAGQQAIPAARAMADGIIEGLRWLITEGPNVLRAMADGIIAAIRYGADLAIAGARSMADGIIAAVRYGADAAIAGARAMADGIIAGIQALPGLAISILRSMADGIIAAVRYGADNAVNGARAMADGIIAGIQALPGVAIGLLRSMADGIIAAVRYGADAAIAGARALADGIIAAIRPLVTDPVGSARSMADGIIAALSSLASTGLDLVRSLADGIISILTSGLSAALGPVRDFADGVISSFKSAYDAVVGNSIIPDMVIEVDDWIRRVPVNADEALRDLPERMGRHFERAGERARGAVRRMQGDLTSFGQVGAPSAAAQGPQAAQAGPGGPPQAAGITAPAGAAPAAQGAQGGQPAASPGSGSRVGINAAEFATTARDAERHLGGLSDSAERHGRETARRLGQHFTEIRSTGAREFTRLTRETDRTVGEMRRAVDAQATGSQVTVSQQSELMRRNASEAHQRLAVEGIRQQTLLQTNTTAQQNLGRDNAVRATEDMRVKNTTALTGLQAEATRQQMLIQANTTIQQALGRDNAVRTTEDMRVKNTTALTGLQTEGTRQQTLLQANTTAQQNLGRDNAVRATEDMRVKNTTALTGLQTEGTRQMTTLQANTTTQATTAQRNGTAQMTALQQNGTSQMTALQQNGTAQTSTLQRNVTTSMTSARDNTISTLSQANQTGSQQLDQLRASGAASMQAADSQWRAPVGAAAQGVQNYLNDMLYGMSQVIAAANLPLTAPQQFGVRLTGGGGSSGGGSGRGFSSGGIVGSRFAGGGGVFNTGPSNPFYAGPGAQLGFDSAGKPTDPIDEAYMTTTLLNRDSAGPSVGGGGSGSFTASVPMSFGMSFHSGGSADVGGLSGAPVGMHEIATIFEQFGGQWDGGEPGIADPQTPRVHLWAEGDKREGFLPEGLSPSRALPILSQMASWYGQQVVPSGADSYGSLQSGEMGGGKRWALPGTASHGSMEHEAVPHGIPTRPGRPRVPSSQALGGPTGPGFVSGRGEDWSQPHMNVEPYIAERANEIASATGTTWNTYVGHGTQGGSWETVTVDFWDEGQGSQSMDYEQGMAVADMVLAKYASDLMYMIAQGSMYRDGWYPFPEDPHYDHTHVSWGGAGGSPGTGGSAAAIRSLIDKNFPEEPSFGTSIPEQAAAAIGKQARDAITAELTKYSGPGRAGSMYSGGGDTDSNLALGQEMAANMGWTGGEWEALQELWFRESGWDHTADNPISDAFGIPQGMVGMHADMPADYVSNPASQIDWGLGYIAQRYGSPSAALAFHDANGSYTSGGIATKPHTATVAENGPEFFMPLHDPSSAVRFLDYIEGASRQRQTRSGGPEGTRTGREHGRNHRGGWDDDVRDVGGRRGRYGAVFGDDTEDERAPSAAGRNPRSAYARLLREGLPVGASAVGSSSGAIPVTPPADQVRRHDEGVVAAKETAASSKAIQQGTPLQQQNYAVDRQTAEGTNQIVRGTALARSQNEQTKRGADAQQATSGGIQQIVNGTPLQSQTAGGATQTAQNTAQMVGQLGALPQQIAGAVAQATPGISAGGASAGGGTARAGGITAGAGQTATNSLRNTTVDQYNDVQNTGKNQGGGRLTVGGQDFSGGGGGGASGRASGSGGGRVTSAPISQNVAVGGNQYAQAAGQQALSGQNSGTNRQSFGIDEPNRRVQVELTANDTDRQSSTSIGGGISRGGGTAGSTSGGVRRAGTPSDLAEVAPGGLAATGTTGTAQDAQAAAAAEARRLQRQREEALRQEIEMLRRDREAMLRERAETRREARELRDELRNGLRDNANAIVGAIYEPTRIDGRDLDTLGKKVKEGIDQAPRGAEYQKELNGFMRREQTKTSWGGN